MRHCAFALPILGIAARADKRGGRARHFAALNGDPGTQRRARPDAKTNGGGTPVILKPPPTKVTRALRVSGKGKCSRYPPTQVSLYGTCAGS